MRYLRNWILTNFDKREEHLYRRAIKEFGGRGLYIDKNAYWKDGHKDNTMSALKYTGYDIYLSKFWKILECVKEDYNKKVNIMGEFRLNIDLYGDKDNSGLIVISDSRSELCIKLPSESLFMDDVTPEEVGKFMTEYLRKHCTIKE